MKVLIVSDTHGRHAGIEEAIEREYPFQKLIHLGMQRDMRIILQIWQNVRLRSFPGIMISFRIFQMKKLCLSMIFVH